VRAPVFSTFDCLLGGEHHGKHQDRQEPGQEAGSAECGAGTQGPQPARTSRQQGMAVGPPQDHAGACVTPFSPTSEDALWASPLSALQITSGGHFAVVSRYLWRPWGMLQDPGRSWPKLAARGPEYASFQAPLHRW